MNNRTKPLINLGIYILLILVLLLSGCRPSLEFPLSKEPSADFSVDFSFPDGAPPLGQEARIIVTAISFVNLHDVQVWVSLPQGLQLASGELTWTGNVTGRPVGSLLGSTKTETVIATVKSVKTGDWEIRVHAYFPKEQLAGLTFPNDGIPFYIRIGDQKSEWREYPPYGNAYPTSNNETIGTVPVVPPGENILPPNYPLPPTTTPATHPSFTLPIKGMELIFETVAGEVQRNIGGSYQGQSARIRIITQTPLPEELEGIPPHEQPRLSETDYTKYFVIIGFNGYRGGIYSYFAIKKIIQDNGTIFVLAHFNDFIPDQPALAASNSQYQAVKISRTQITQPGTITFRLLDETGQERATVTSELK